MVAKVGGGLKMVAKRAFLAKVAKLANPARGAETYKVENGKVSGVPLNVLIDAIVASKNRFVNDGQTLIVAKRK